MPYAKTVPLKHLMRDASPEDEVCLLSVTNEQPEDADTLRDGINAVESTPGAVGRYIGLYPAGPPRTGSWQVGDWCMTQAGGMWVCTHGGTTPKWIDVKRERDNLTRSLVPRADYNSTRIFPGRYSSVQSFTNERLYLVPYPLEKGLQIDAIFVNLVAAAHASDTGALVHATIYEDSYGKPRKRLTTASVAATTTGAKTITLPTKVKGGKWIWIGIHVSGAPTGAPTTAMFDYQPYPLANRTSSSYSQQTNVSLYRNSTTTPPERLFVGALATDLMETKMPWFGFDFSATTDEAGYDEPDRFPVLMPTESYEESTLQEPNVYYDASRAVNERYVMVHTYGWNNPGAAWATAPHPMGPWTKKGIFWAESQGKTSIHFEAGTLYVYSAGGNLEVRSGTAPDTLGAVQNCMPAIANLTSGWQNTCLVKRGTGDYLMFVESKISTWSSPANWVTGYATGTSPLGPFTIQQFPIAGLVRNTGGMFGGPNCTYDGTTYKMWLHAGDVANEPTEIYHCESTDLVTWTGPANPEIKREHELEVDQVADAFFFRDPVSGVGYLYWDALNNQSPPHACLMCSNPNVLTVSE